MTIISYNHGHLVYIIHKDHEACIMMSASSGDPIADIFIDDFFAEIPECSVSTKDGHPLKVAMKLAASELRIRDRIDRGLAIDHDCAIDDDCCYRLCGLDWDFVDEFLDNI